MLGVLSARYINLVKGVVRKRKDRHDDPVFRTISGVQDSGESRIRQTEGANPKDGGANVIFLSTFLENCMKLKKIGSGECPALDPPLCELDAV